MANDKSLNARLSPFGLTAKDLSASELKKARKDVSGSRAGGFFSSGELISKSFEKMAKRKK